MALRKEDKEALKKLGLDPDKLEAAAKADTEIAIEVPADVTVIKNTDLATRDNTKIEEGKALQKPISEEHGKELAAKAFRKKFSLDDALGKDVDKIVEAVNGKIAGGDTTLKAQNEALLLDKKTLEKQLEDEKVNAAKALFERDLVGKFPANRTPDLKDDERLTLMNRDITWETVDGKRVAKRNGEVLKDKTTHAPLPEDKVIAEYFTERKWVASGTGGQGGRGGNDNPAGGGANGLKKASAVQAKWLEANPGGNIISPECMNFVAAAAKDIPDFDYYS